MNKHEAVGRVVALLKGAGLPIYAYGSRREPIRWGVQVALGWRRRGTIDVQTQGDPDGVWFNRAREVLRDAGWTEIYVNEPGHAVSVRVPVPVRSNPGLRSFLPPDVSLASALLPAARAPVPGRAAPARYLIRWIEGDPAVADLLAGRVVDTLVGLQRVLQALAGSAAGRATGRYLKVSLVPFHGEPPDPESSVGALRIDLQHEDADELDLADPNSPHSIPSTVQEQSQPATARDNELVAEVRRLQAEADEEAYNAFNEPPAPAPRRPVEPVPEWTSPTYGPVYVKPGDWTNLGAVVDGKRMRYGWNAAQGRWARGEVPPAALLNEALEHGWSFWLGEGAPKAEAPTHGASRDAPPPNQKAQPVAVEEEPTPAKRPTFEITETLVPWEELRKGDIVIRWDERTSVTWVGVINPELKISQTPIGTIKQLRTNFKELMNSSAMGRDNRVASGNGKHIPANDFTFANIVYRRAAYDRERGYKHIHGWGSALIRHYLDQLGVAYDPHARFLRETEGREPHFYDITAPVDAVYGGPATRPKTGTPDLQPRPGDILVERNEGYITVSAQGRGAPSDAELRRVTPAHSSVKDGARTWEPGHISWIVSKVAAVDAPDFTEGNIRAYGRRLLDKYQRWMHQVAALLMPLEDHELAKVTDLPLWRLSDDYELRQIREKLALVPESLPTDARVLYRTGRTQHWEDVTQGTAAGRLPPVRPLPGHPLARAVKAEARPFDAAAYAGKLRDLADRMEDTIQDKLDPAIGHQNLTHRRAGIASGMRAEGVALQRIQGMLRALADAAEAGTLPESLRGVTARTEVETLSYPWRRLVKDIEHNEEYRHPDKVKELRAILEHNLIGNYEGARLPGHWRNWKEERRSVLEKAPKKQASRVFLKWADDLHYDTSAVPPPAVADAIIELGTDVFSAMAVDLAKSARRAYRLGASDNRTWHQLLLDFRPIWEAGRRERRSAAEIQREKIRELEREIIGTKIPGFFPTPRGLARRAVEAARIRPGARVLEPSAGKGDMALAVRELHPDAQTDVVEHAYTLRKFLELHGFNLVAHDFMEYNPGPVYDAVVMNPPFEDGQDAAHVMRAYTMLRPGGRLAAIMSSGPFFRSFKRDQAFRDWLEEVGGQVEDLPEGSFTGAESFRQTGVNTKLVVIERAL